MKYFIKICFSYIAVFCLLFPAGSDSFGQSSISVLDRCGGSSLSYIPDNDLWEDIKNIIMDVANIYEGNITEEARLADDLGLDENQIYEILSLCCRNFNIEITENEAELIVTVGDLYYLCYDKIN